MKVCHVNSIAQTIQTVQQQQQQQQQPVDSIKQSPPSTQQSQQIAAPSVLRVIVENMCYQITVDTLKQVRTRIKEAFTAHELN